MNIHDACDYIIHRIDASGESLSNLKLQKLMYYVQAWRLAFEESSLFEGRFQAWVHGPVSREIYDRFASSKSLYSDITLKDVRDSFNAAELDDEEKAHIDRVLSVYAKYSGPQLEEMTHREFPWVNAREGYAAWDRCETEISEEDMQRCYAARLN